MLNPLGHATVADRGFCREQRAILICRYPHRRSELLADLDAVERRAVEDIVTIRGSLAPALAPASGPLQSLLAIRHREDGPGFVAYLGRPDGVYVAPIGPDLALGEAQPYASWSIWQRERGAR